MIEGLKHWRFFRLRSSWIDALNNFFINKVGHLKFILKIRNCNVRGPFPLTFVLFDCLFHVRPADFCSLFQGHDIIVGLCSELLMYYINLGFGEKLSFHIGSNHGPSDCELSLPMTYLN